MAKGGLGTGLGALFEDNFTDTQVKRTLRLSEIEPNREQPRKDFNEEAIVSLANSISEYGIIQPIVVRPMAEGVYRIVAGERRWRAARMLGLSEVPVIIQEIDDRQAAQIALIENLQREDLNPIEISVGYKELMEQYDMTQEDVSKMVGRSRSAIANSLRFLNLPDDVKEMLKNGEITSGHAKALAAIEDEQTIISLAKKAADGQMTVRAIEKAASENVNAPKKDKNNDTQIDNYFKEMEIALNERLGRRVKIDYGKNKGAIILEFYDKDDLAALTANL